ncbi:V-type ATPase 116kDa subunit family protein [Actinoallomurus sp. NPDC050550]|uniref:V-type ATPase 116kDa subunit family protein n=1 Tax=Actinoallomurus sp. NPDC050550 TaxID=3154937 RepID=UPI00340E9868
MRSRGEAAGPIRMARVAVVAPCEALRDVLVRVADAGVVEFDGPVTRPEPEAALSLRPPSDSARPGIVLGEARLKERARDAAVDGTVAAMTGWAPVAAVPGLAERLAPEGGVVVLPRPRGVDVPSLLRTGGLRGSLTPLVETYGTVPYRDVDPTPAAVAAYLLMFGMMFGDVGHGALLLMLAIALRRLRRLARFRRAWPFAAGAGLSGIGFGLLYGEFFGPTGLVPALWLRPLERPVPLLVAAVGVGAVLLMCAALLGAVNRVREGGWKVGLYASSGVAGAALPAGLGLIAAGWYWRVTWLVVLGAVIASAGIALMFAGFVSESGVFEALMELFDTVLGLGSNVASFTRLAAFGLAHAAIGLIVWNAARALWHLPGAGAIAAVAVFVVGNLVAFVLEGVVVAVQALRLEYYELFSKVFQLQGRPFRPWHIPIATEEVTSCPPGSSSSR